MNTPLGTILVVISGLCWSAVYAGSIYTGFKQKTYCMPLFALALNIAWEGIYAYTDLFLRQNITAQACANTVWFLLDIVIVYTYFKFSKNDCKSEPEQKWQIPFGILALVLCFGIQLLFIAEFGSDKAEIYSAYLQNIAMSIAYLYMLNRRRSTKGQTMLIAVCKCVGTVAPTLIGIIENNMFIVATGCVCFVLDILYIYFLNSVKKASAEIDTVKKTKLTEAK